ncbi:hypothetical protein QBC38DRAFT_486580 [Podospora fimiseda]|uniref:Uncharacterized protein n=1 Tax=Podospora fimiseda TaxID=252190 RepID=A0AAN7BI53_9PEZI|nr:hypothetical protein QBC38DRAFT_486580 [Podospora fimiseda]
MNPAVKTTGPLLDLSDNIKPPAPPKLIVHDSAMESIQLDNNELDADEHLYRDFPWAGIEYKVEYVEGLGVHERVLADTLEGAHRLGRTAWSKLNKIKNVLLSDDAPIDNGWDFIEKEEAMPNASFVGVSPRPPANLAPARPKKTTDAPSMKYLSKESINRQKFITRNYGKILLSAALLEDGETALAKDPKTPIKPTPPLLPGIRSNLSARRPKQPDAPRKSTTPATSLRDNSIGSRSPPAAEKKKVFSFSGRGLAPVVEKHIKVKKTMEEFLGASSTTTCLIEAAVQSVAAPYVVEEPMKAEENPLGASNSATTSSQIDTAFPSGAVTYVVDQHVAATVSDVKPDTEMPFLVSAFPVYRHQFPRVPGEEEQPNELHLVEVPQGEGQ